MRALTIPRYGPPEVLEVREVPDPVPGTGQVCIRVQRAGSTSPTSLHGSDSTRTRRRCRR